MNQYNKGLISIITPAYNTAKYLPSLLDSILKQKYDKIEMFLIDDGSTDNVREVVDIYLPKFEERGLKLNYVYQTNSGQSVAINNGLKLVSGEFLVWPDSDDYFASATILQRMVAIFNSDESIGMVRSQELLIEDRRDDLIHPLGLQGESAVELAEPRQLFEDCLFTKNGFYFCAGAYMLKTQYFSKVNNGLQIFTEKDAGQNWQLMLPMLYYYKCYTIREPLYHVRVRLSSHSRGQYDTYEKKIKKFTSYYKTLISTLNQFNLAAEERDRYKSLLAIHYAKLFFQLDCYYLNKENGKLHYQQIKEKEANSVKEDLLYCSLLGGFSRMILKMSNLCGKVKLKLGFR